LKVTAVVGATDGPTAEFKNKYEALELLVKLYKDMTPADLFRQQQEEQQQKGSESDIQRNFIWGAKGSSVMDGPVTDGPVMYGPVMDGTVMDGPVMYGPVMDGPVMDGPVMDAPVSNAPTSSSSSTPYVIKYKSNMHMFAPTGNFKGPHDSGGGLTKTSIRTYEKEGNLFHNTEMVFDYFTSHVLKSTGRNPLQTDPKKFDKELNKIPLGAIYDRIHLLVIDIQNTTEDQVNKSRSDNRILIINTEDEKFECEIEKGITTHYELIAMAKRYGGEELKPCLNMRKLPCACNACLNNLDKGYFDEKCLIPEFPGEYKQLNPTFNTMVIVILDKKRKAIENVHDYSEKIQKLTEDTNFLKKFNFVIL
jgi:hypothetical protein